jgi:hypothetical protein
VQTVREMAVASVIATIAGFLQVVPRKYAATHVFIHFSVISVCWGHHVSPYVCDFFLPPLRTSCSCACF